MKLYQNWWFLSIKGSFTVLLGLILIINPHMFGVKLTSFIGFLIGLSGVAIVVGAILNRRNNYDWTWWLVEGLIDLMVSVMIFIDPFDLLEFLPFIISVWILLMGFIHIATAINIQYYIPGNYVFVLSSILLVISGFVFTFVRFSGLSLYLTLLGAVTLIYGVTQIYISTLLKGVIIEEIGEIEGLF